MMIKHRPNADFDSILLKKNVNPGMGYWGFENHVPSKLNPVYNKIMDNVRTVLAFIQAVTNTSPSGS